MTRSRDLKFLLHCHERAIRFRVMAFSYLRMQQNLGYKEGIAIEKAIYKKRALQSDRFAARIIALFEGKEAHEKDFNNKGGGA